MKSVGLILIALGLFFSNSKTSAKELNFNIVPNYNCQVILAAESEEESFEEHFLADYASGSHGGREYEFKRKGHVLTVLASNNWMAIHWEKEGETVAEGHFVVSEAAGFHRVILLINPKNRNQQVSLDCSPEELESHQL